MSLVIHQVLPDTRKTPPSTSPQTLPGKTFPDCHHYAQVLPSLFRNREEQWRTWADHLHWVQLYLITDISQYNIPTPAFSQWTLYRTPVCMQTLRKQTQASTEKHTASQMKNKGSKFQHLFSEMNNNCFYLRFEHRKTTNVPSLCLMILITWNKCFDFYMMFTLSRHGFSMVYYIKQS